MDRLYISLNRKSAALHNIAMQPVCNLSSVNKTTITELTPKAVAESGPSAYATVLGM